MRLGFDRMRQLSGQSLSRNCRVVGAEGKSTAAYIEVREETFYPMATH